MADTNYFSETNCEYIFTNKIDGYIPDTGFRKRDPRFPEKKEESREKSKYQQQDFNYNHEQNCYYCPLGKNKTYSQKMIAKIDTIKGRDIYMQRMGIVEPVFASITYHKRMNRFHLRGRNKVKIQWLLYNIVHNIEKIAKYGKLNKLKIA